MERDIKFRGKRVDNGEWVYGSLMIHGRCCYILPENPSPFGILNYRVNPETVGQFTGLLDKNGVEIYEGDIIRFCDDPPYCSDYIVKYDDERLIWIASGAVGDFMDDLWELGVDYVEVIGNIHDD